MQLELDLLVLVVFPGSQMAATAPDSTYEVKARSEKGGQRPLRRHLWPKLCLMATLGNKVWGTRKDLMRT